MNVNSKKPSPIRLVFAIGIFIAFIALGFHIIKENTIWAKIVGYANIIYFSAMLVATGIIVLIKKIKNRNSPIK